MQPRDPQVSDPLVGQDPGNAGAFYSRGVGLGINYDFVTVTGMKNLTL
jgi:hypothetical protein